MQAFNFAPLAARALLNDDDAAAYAEAAPRLPGRGASVSRGALADAVKVATSVAETRAYLPILNNVRVSGNGESLTVSATDMESAVAVTIPAAASPGLDFTTNAKALGAVLRSAKSADSVSLFQNGDAVSPSGDSLTVDMKAGTAETRLDCIAVAYRRQLPAGGAVWSPAWPGNVFAPVGENQTTFTMRGAELADAVARVSFAISTEETRYYLNGAFLHVVDRGAARAPALRMVTTDGHRLARYTFAAVPAGAERLAGVVGEHNGGVIIPTSALKALGKLLRKSVKAAPAGDVLVTVSAGAIRFQFDSWCGRVLLQSKLINGTFPDYERVIPRNNPHAVAVPVRAMLDAVGIVAAGVSSRGEGDAVAFMPDGDSALVKLRDGTASQRLAVTVGETVPSGFRVGFSARYMRATLEAFGGDRVTLAFADPGCPFLFRGDGSAALLAVLVPMRL